MGKRNIAALVVTGAVTPMLVMTAATPASANPPVGTCTNSYSPYTSAELAFDPAAQAIFPVIDANGDGYVCFKYYPNGPHAGHAGNLVDDKAAPHQ